MWNKGCIKDSVLLILLIFIVVGYSNGNKSFTGRLFSNYESVEYAIPFFSYLIFFDISRDFSQNVYRETILFQLKIQKSISRCSILQKIRVPNFVKKLKNLSFLGAVFSEIKKCWHFGFPWIKYFGNDYS